MDSQRKFLYLLKTRGPLSAAAISRTLGMTKEAARQMLHKLSDDKLVQCAAQTSGVGRPTNVWQLTDQGNTMFPDTHGELTVELLNHVRQLFGEEGMSRLIKAREQSTRTFYRSQIAEGETVEEKVKKLARLRSDEGYMAQWEKTDDGYLLIENHCPICAAAATCQGFCQAELTTFQSVLGPEVTVERTDHIIAGARRCAYRIATDRKVETKAS